MCPLAAQKPGGLVIEEQHPQQITGGAELDRYLNFDQISGFEDSGRVVSVEEEAKVLAGV